MPNFSNTALTKGKFMFAASWPGENFDHEVWTFSEIAMDFIDNPEFLAMLLDLEFTEVVYLESCNLCLQRIPDFLRHEEVEILEPEWLNFDYNVEEDSADDDCDDDNDDDDQYV